MFNQAHIFATKDNATHQSIKEGDIVIKELTKLAEKLKWIERFCKSYSGGKRKVAPEQLAICKVFVATIKGKEAGYIRIGNYTESFSKFFDGEVWSVCEGYVKPPYRSNGILSALRSYVVKNHNVKVVRIETDRYFRLKDYFSEEGFVYGYEIQESDLSLICLPEFIDALFAYSSYSQQH